MWNFIVVFILLTGGHRAQDILHHACPDKHIVSQINSPADKDHQWKIECRAFRAASRCSWSGPLDKKLSNNCPANHVVAGVHSNNNSTHGNRSWKLLCCSAPNFTTFECRETPMVNYFNEDFNWELPAGHFLTGVQIHQKNINGDHRWSFNFCKGTTKGEDHFMERDVFVRNKRSARKCDNCRWPKTHEMVQVPYTISNNFTSEQKETILSAMNEFHLTTCVRFVARKEQDNFINIVKSKTTCESHIGRAGGDQSLSLSDGCVQKGNIQHELIHTLGFWHEQNRYDRDDYINVNFENIIDSQRKNFMKHDTNNLDVPYDYSSVMHYGPKTFSKNDEDTIVPFDPSAIIGQRYGMSKFDILKINKLYNCKNYIHKYGKWDNHLYSILSRTCPSGQAVSGIESHYIRDHQARLWAFSCKVLRVTTTCRWSASLDNFEKDFTFKCGDNKVIAGAYSYHSNIYQDREWRFYCCSDPGLTTSNCRTTNINNLEESFDWTAPSDHYLSGVKSSFSHETRDRRWTFTYCQVDTH